MLDAVRRLRRQKARRGNAGRKRRRGRPRKGAKRHARRKGPSNEEKAAFVFERRYLIVKRQENLSEPEQKDLRQMFDYLPELQTQWQFSQELYKLWDTGQSRKVARWRWTRLKNNPAYQHVPELAKLLSWLDEKKFEKTQAFLGQPVKERVKTNNHVERTNRRLRFDEKVRYKWRKRRSIVRFVILRISRYRSRPTTQTRLPSEQTSEGCFKAAG